MARPRQVSEADLLAAARRCFLEHGPSVSTTVIAKEVGLSQAALFKRYGTKEDLMYAALLPPERPAWIDHVEQGPDDRPVPAQLLDIAERITAFFLEMTPCMMALKASGTDMRAAMSRYEVPPPVRGIQAMAGWFGAMADAGRILPGDPHARAFMLLGSLHGQVFLSHITGLHVVEVDAYLSELIDTLWRGLTPEEER